MTVFVVSLFLPYTVTRQIDSCGSSQVQSPAPARLPQCLSTLPSRRDGGCGSDTTLKGDNLSPGATTDNERIFTSDPPLRARKGVGYPFPPKPRSDNWPRTKGEPQWSVITAKKGNDGLVDAIRSAAHVGYLNDTMWVGTLGIQTDSIEYCDRTAIERKLKDEYESLAVFVCDRDFDGHYTHFCKTILWPIFHYQVPDSPKNKAYQDCSWAYYVSVNQAFTECIARNWKRGDSIWVQDYHLMLVPAMLRKLLPDAHIGFFLHSAFPSSEVFRCLAMRKELLEGMLGADLIGFQVTEYSGHFLRACGRVLSVEATDAGIQLEDRFIKVGTFPIGIDPTSWDRRRESADIRHWMDNISTAHRGKRLIVSCDKIDAVGGIRQKLLSYEHFLNIYPEWANQVVLIQVATSSTQQPELEASISDIAMRINSIYATLDHQPLVFLKQDLMFPQYLALITAADVLMITSLREGMNLISHEFVYCQDGRFNNKGYGSLILSEFTGSASLFSNHALLVNPWNVHQCAEAMHTALIRDPRERKKDWEQLHQLVLDNSATNWVKSFKESMACVCHKQLSHRRMTKPCLSIASLKERYRQACRRMMFIQYEGALAPWGSPNNVFLATPQRTITILTDLIDDAANDVYVMSSRMPEELERQFCHVIGVGLIAENGCFLRKPHTNEWIQLVDQAYTDVWKDGPSHILTYFQERMEGSWVETRHYSLVFHYGSVADREMARRLTAECADQINDACESQGIHAVIFDSAMIVEPINTKKALAAEVVWRYVESSNNPKFDFLLTIGVNREDEHLFGWANELERTGVVDYTMTVTIGSHSAEAKTTLTQGVTGVLDCLQQLASC
ncbi:hypothetical protein PENARI_c003G06306 [Penicillium arizonense]|uniref:Uncharacterized protein n=1 Tax=Penicillium arizonense TaxID=1835702 RepID=A0A1F5LSW9_PENAI|nr:hypothetical protein PENARI_c003G06306 [Penicillium arizonense]OGE56255.1 hypothetical protein PENARI_c003G06306 [Penicillium arizonense]